MSEKPCPKCRGTGWCPGEEVDDEIICTKCGGRGTLRNTTHSAPQEKNSAPLLSGGNAVKQNTPGEESPARNIGSLAGDPCSDQATHSERSESHG